VSRRSPRAHAGFIVARSGESCAIGPDGVRLVTIVTDLSSHVAADMQRHAADAIDAAIDAATNSAADDSERTA
jgi:hypothetical protein